MRLAAAPAGQYLYTATHIHATGCIPHSLPSRRRVIFLSQNENAYSPEIRGKANKYNTNVVDPAEMEMGQWVMGQCQ